MLAINIAIVILGLTCIPAAYRMFAGPTAADRVAAADLLMIAVIGLVALMGVRYGSNFTFDLVFVASLIGFVSAVSLARALTGGIR